MRARANENSFKGFLLLPRELRQTIPHVLTAMRKEAVWKWAGGRPSIDMRVRQSAQRLIKVDT